MPEEPVRLLRSVFPSNNWHAPKASSAIECINKNVEARSQTFIRNPCRYLQTSHILIPVQLIFRSLLLPSPPPPHPAGKKIDKELSASIIRFSSSPKYARHKKVTLFTNHGVVNNAIRLSPKPYSTFSTPVRLQ